MPGDKNLALRQRTFRLHVRLGVLSSNGASSTLPLYLACCVDNLVLDKINEVFCVRELAFPPKALEVRVQRGYGEDSLRRSLVVSVCGGEEKGA